jgi:cytochrome c
MPLLLSRLALVIVLAGAALCGAGAGQLAAEDGYRVLVFSRTTGFRHDSIETGIAAVKQLGVENHFAVDASEDPVVFAEDNLKRYKVVMFLNTTGHILEAPQQEAMQRFIEAGGGFVGVHSATDTEYDWPWYGRLVGTYFAGHPAIQKARVTVGDKTHPASAGLPDTIERTDEWYNFKYLPKDVHVLVSIDEGSYQGGAMNGNHPLVWWHLFDGGRAFYTEMGHTKESYAEPAYLKLLLGGISWAAAGKELDYGAARPSETRFEKTVLSRDLADCMQFTLLPDGRIVVVEKFGAVKLIKAGGGATVLAGTVPVYAVQDGHNNVEDGLLGVAADPDFAHNHWLYMLHSVPGDVPVQHLSRFTLDGDKLDLASEKVLFDIPNCRSITGHCGGGMSFSGNDLYLSTGDNTTPFESDGFSPQDARVEGKDARATAANSMDLRGKILRIRPKADGTYEIPKGNLFPPGTPSTRPEIYVMGCRNPFRHFADPVTGFLYWGEVGPDAGNDSERGSRGYDEFNQARAPGFFGWPLFVGNNSTYAAYDWDTKKIGGRADAQHPRNDSPRNTGIKDLPPAQPAYLWYPYAVSPEFPELGSGGRCAMSGPVYHFNAALTSGDRFPAFYDNTWFIYDWMRNWIKAIKLDEHGNKAAIEDFMPSLKLAKPMDMKFGPDGALYLLEYGSNWYHNTDAQLSRITFAAGNRAPIAMAGADRTAGREPLTVAFSSAGSYDKDEGDTITFAWSFTGDKVESSEPNPHFTFTQPGLYQARLTVTDRGGKTGSTVIPIQVGNAVPRIAIDQPKPGGFFAWGEQIAFKVTVTDDEDGSSADGSIPGSAITVSGSYDNGGAGSSGAPVGVESQMMAANGHEAGRNLVTHSDCIACHTLQAQSVGPAFFAIAQKYKGDAAALERLVQKVQDGGSGVWGIMAMAAHPQFTKVQLTDMVGWVLSLSDEAGRVHASSGTLTVMPKPAKDDKGVYVITATYTDKGATKGGKAIPAQSAAATVVLRSRYLRATDSTGHQGGVKAEECSDEGGGQDLGFINSGDWISFTGLDLEGCPKATFRVASAGAGGRIELHADSASGPLLGSATVAATGGWQKWTDVDAAISAPGGSHDLVLVFKHDQNAGGLFNLNWVHFHPPARK